MGGRARSKISGVDRVHAVPVLEEALGLLYLRVLGQMVEKDWGYCLSSA
jgi:hypothetical protein